MFGVSTDTTSTDGPDTAFAATFRPRWALSALFNLPSLLLAVSFAVGPWTDLMTTGASATITPSTTAMPLARASLVSTR